MQLALTGAEITSAAPTTVTARHSALVVSVDVASDSIPTAKTASVSTCLFVDVLSQIRGRVQTFIIVGATKKPSKQASSFISQNRPILYIK